MADGYDVGDLESNTLSILSVNASFLNLPASYDFGETEPIHFVR